MPTGLIAATALAIAATFAGATAMAGGLARLGFPLPEPEGRIGCVDALRGYLALIIFVTHFLISSRIDLLARNWESFPFALIPSLGSAAVMLFFMTTGLVFYPRILRGFAAVDWRSVAVGRVFRIVPLSVVTLGIILVIAHLRTGNLPDASTPIAAAKWITGYREPDLLGYPDTRLINGGVFWTLWYEWLFYISVLPACAFASDRLRGIAPSWTIPLLVLVAGLVGRLAFPDGLPRYLPAFALGMLAFEVSRIPAAAAALKGRAAGWAG